MKIREKFFKALLATAVIALLGCGAGKNLENTEAAERFAETENALAAEDNTSGDAESVSPDQETEVWPETEEQPEEETQTEVTEPAPEASEAAAEADETAEAVPEAAELALETAELAPASAGLAAEAEVQRPKVRGIYVTGPMAGTENMNSLIDLVDRTELNAMVIDVKNDEGRVVCEMSTPTVQEIGAVKRYVRDMPALVQKCKEKNIYLIARIVAFKDPYLAEARPEWSLHNADGSIFRDKSGQAWVNPYEQQVWDYLLEVAEGAVDLGFDEVQFDYIRFSTDSGMKNVDFGPAAAEKSKTDVITEFTAYAAERLHAKGAAVSADVYGVVIDSEVDQQIVGQDYTEMAKYLDCLSPMVYPSHYGAYNYGIPVPDAQPYDTVLAAMQASKKVLAGMEPVAEEAETAEDMETAVSGNDAAANVPGNGISGSNAAADVSGNGMSGSDAADVSGNTVPDSSETSDAAQEPELTKEEIAALQPLPEIRATARPWLQDFTATWVKGHISYGPEQIRQQIQAVYDAGYEEWILWNAANRYTEGGLLGPEAED